MSEYLSEWPIIDAGSPGQADQHDIIDGRPPEGALEVPPLFYSVLDPEAPENQVNVTPFSKYWYWHLPIHMKEHDQIQNPLDGGWPMLRFMDAIGHIADGVRATVQDMYNGVWTDPATVPDRSVPWLASVLGVPQSQKNVPVPQLREVLSDMVANGRPPVGTRAEIAAAARQFLIGSKEALVVPQVSITRSLNQEDLDLATAVGYAGRAAHVHVSTLAPAATLSYSWTGTPHSSTSQRHEDGNLTGENLVHNPAFELDLTGWTTDADITQERVTDRKETGAASAKLTPIVADWYWIEAYRNAPATGDYIVRFRVWVDTARTVRPRIWQYDGGTTTTGDPVTLVAGSWQWVEMPFSIVDTAHRYRVSLVSDAGDADVTPLWVDRVYAARTEYAVSGYFDGDTPDSVVDDLWVNPTDSTVNTWDGTGWVTYTATNVDAERNAVITARETETFLRAHTIVIIVRPDDVPGGDLPALTENMRDVGAIPAGHAVTVVLAQPTWANFEAAVAEAGGTWADYERITKTWSEVESLGLGDLGV